MGEVPNRVPDASARCRLRRRPNCSTTNRASASSTRNPVQHGLVTRQRRGHARARRSPRASPSRSGVPPARHGVPWQVLSSSVGAWQTWPMKSDTPSYHGYRFPHEIISHAVWLYHRFGVSFRDVEDLLAQRGVTVSYEAIRLWCLTFGSAYARRLKRRQGRLGDTWHLDEVFVTIQGRRHYTLACRRSSWRRPRYLRPVAS